MNHSLIALCAVLLLGACTVQERSSELADLAFVTNDTTRTSVDWPGRYVGTLPCASCPGIETVLTINEAGFYTLVESDVEASNADLTSAGEFVWDRTGRIIELKGEDEKRAFMIGEGMAWMVGADGKPDDNHPLTKLTEFNGAGAQLYIDPKTVSRSGAKPTFSALVNFEHQAPAGHRSLSALFTIDCVKRLVDLSRVRYFEKWDGKGKLIDEVDGNAGHWRPSPSGKDEVMAQAMAAYCLD